MTIETVRTAELGSTTWDDVVTGLHLRVSGTGCRRWFLFYRTKTGVQRRPKLGEYPLVSLQDARERARRLLGMVAVGQDPVAEWRAARGEITVAELFEKLKASYSKRERFQASGRTEEVERIYRRHILKPLGRLKLSELTPGTVREWHESMEAIPFGANRALEVLSRMLRFGEERDIRPLGSNPCTMVPSFPEGRRSRFPTEEEIIRIGKVLDRDAETFPFEVAFIALLILTGSRPKFIVDAKRTDLEVYDDIGWLTLPGKTTSETGEPEVVVIPPQAMRVIKRLPVRSDGLLIGGPPPRRYWERIRKEVNCPDLWMRDWRRAFASVGLSSGISLGLIGELLNHRDADTTKRYAKLLPKNRLEAARMIANRMETLLSPSSEQVPRLGLSLASATSS